jgi:hypothetical protein
MDMIGRIRRLHSREEQEVGARDCAHDGAVAQHGPSGCTAPMWMARRSTGAASSPSKLTPFHDVLRQALKADARRPRHERRTARALYTEIKARATTAATAGDRLHPRLAPGEGQTAVANAFVPLAFELGEAFQFDWSEEGLVVGGIYYRLQVAHMKLCASRAFWLVAYPSQGHEMLFDAHTRSFAALGGVARRGIYDNMKTAVDKVKKGKGRTVNARFAVMCAHYLFDPTSATWPRAGRRASSRRTCRTAAGASGSTRQAALRQLRRTQRLAGRALPGAVGGGAPPRARAVQRGRDAEHERAHLMPMPAPFDGYVEKPARVSSTCLVSVARNRYSVPCELAGQMVSTRLYPSGWWSWPTTAWWPATSG